VGELVFFAAILLFTILEAVAKSRRKREEGEGQDADAESPQDVAAEIQRRREEARRQRAEAGRAAQQRDPGTQPNRPGAGDRARVGGPAPMGPAGRGGMRRTEGAPSGEEPSTTMVPPDLWEEIADLMSGGRRPEASPVPEAPRAPRTVPVPEPEQPSPTRTRTRTTPVPTRSAAAAARRDAAHTVHRSHPEFGMDPSERVPSAFDLRAPAHGRSAHASRVRSVLQGSDGADALKQAIILQEILGPPASLKKKD